MNWSALSAVADLTAAIAVVLTLVYVAIQLRHNTRATRSTALQALTSDLGQALQAQAANPELADIVRRGLSAGPSLDESENFRFLSQMGHVFRLYESLHAHHLAGTLDPDIWSGYETAIRALLAYPGARSVWDLRSEVYSAPFRRFVESGFELDTEAHLFDRVQKAF